VLGAHGIFPEEDMGVVPPAIEGVKLMTPAFYAGDNPLPLRGSEVTDAIIELLTITRWGDLTVLFVDLPPGTGEEVLDVTRLIPKAEVVLVSTPSKLSLNGVSRLALLLRELRVKILGVVENMSSGESSLVRKHFEELGVKYLGWLPFDPRLEECVGRPKLLLETSFAKKICGIASGILRDL